ncbi:MAG: heavy metal-responsive transcriptional regulator [Bacillati bacterium ANGP1]|uniref:Heavy metal-responsive transcriptional regulator n=1 Tax=Candidatus Segetimicrobium genomatis TaxID=2569760 RepID=A0A537M1J3_9BACT|nr:MAG: heavy metal-responsive transcriptional regulator [Terrabacteria group bacterium ANGP1]
MSGKFIGTLAKEVGVNPRTVRFYEAERLLPRPARTESGYRVYGDEAAQRLTFIAKAKCLGLSLREIRQILVLRDSGRWPCDSVRQILTDHLGRIDEQMARLQGFKSDLQMMLATCRRSRNSGGRIATRKTICPAIETLAGNGR